MTSEQVDLWGRFRWKASERHLGGSKVGYWRPR